MWVHFLNLLGRSWENMVKATGTTTLGFIVWTLAIAVVGWSATVASRWLDLRKERPLNPFRTALRSSVRPGTIPALGFGFLVLLTLSMFVVNTTYDDHQSLVAERDNLACESADLASQLDNEKHTLVNAFQLEGAFVSYRRAIGFSTPCHIKFTAPPESMQFAITVAGLATQGSQCQPFGPESSDMNPDAEREAMNGMVPGVVVFHIARGDKEATQLFVSLENSMRLKLSYKIPAGSPAHFIWLQFGTNTKWNSQLRSGGPF